MEDSRVAEDFPLQPKKCPSCKIRSRKEDKFE